MLFKNLLFKFFPGFSYLSVAGPEIKRDPGVRMLTIYFDDISGYRASNFLPISIGGNNWPSFLYITNGSFSSL